MDGTRALAADITGVILVGGKSRRMGRDKAFLDFAGRPLVERVLDLFRESFARVVLVGDREERFASYELPVLPDLFPGSALGGLYTGLMLAETEHIFVASCDIPYPSPEVLRLLCSLRDGYDAVVPVPEHGFEPLFALYARSCLGAIRGLLESGNFCVYDFYPEVNIRYVTREELVVVDPDGRAFVSVNTPGEFALLTEQLA